MLNKVVCRVDKSEKEYYKKLIKDSQPLLEKLIDMLKEEIKDLDIINDEDFDNPSWALKQAYKVGYKKGLTRLIEYGILGND
jgi:hypothetical protein